jgi:3-hydroxyacyl-[acyl-carrier-protein] dehydratase
VHTDLVALLPHRPPFRFVDGVDAIEAGTSIRARYRVTGDEPFLAGHFPGNPVFPGVLQLEALAQAGGIAVLADPRYADRLPLFGGVEETRFRRIVRPGDELVLDVTMERLSARGGWGRGVATVEGEECCRARLLFALAPAAS